ncbi:MAG: hypothetical protein FD129_520 [bacterium]|nr:MAG: hypothetical protein FD129_520 [bacterium]
MISVSIDPALAPLLKIGLVDLSGLTVHAENPRWDAVENLCAECRTEFGDTPIGRVPGVEWARQLYSSVGIDPTKHRPSSEALLRRALKGEPLHQINTLVDALNWCSLEYLIPMGLYSSSRIEGDVVVRRGKPGEAYEGIGRGIVNLEGRLVAADRHGAFGSPTSDSYRTAISTDTRQALAILYVPIDYPEDELAEAVETFAERAQSWCGGEAQRTDVVR